jgi:hypothetical protein
VFFQTLGAPWEYEPEGFRLSTGEWYLPDFRVRLVDTVLWCEVKPSGQPADLFDRFRDDNLTTSGDDMPDFSICMIVLREIPDPDDDNYFSVGWDECYQFCICSGCGAIGFEFSGRSERIRCGCENKTEEYTAAHPRILQAFAAARAARFEHDERSPWR